MTWYLWFSFGLLIGSTYGTLQTRRLMRKGWQTVMNPNRPVDRIRIEIEQDGKTVSYEMTPQTGPIYAAPDLSADDRSNDVTVFGSTSGSVRLQSRLVTLRLVVSGRDALVVRQTGGQ